MKPYQEALIWVGYRVFIALLILASNYYSLTEVY